MENDEFFAEPSVKYSKGRKFLFELRDLLTGVAFPFIMSAIFSATVIAFASSEDLVLSIVALVFGELMFAASLIIFGRANGSAAYKRTIYNLQKRELGSSDERVVYHTGEYALWKGFLIGFIMCIPFIIFQTIQLCAENTFCSFCMQYVFGWAYYPFSYLGKQYQALNYITIILPVGVHAVGYYLGKLRQIEVQRKLEETNPDRKRRKK